MMLPNSSWDILPKMYVRFAFILYKNPYFQFSPNIHTNILLIWQVVSDSVRNFKSVLWNIQTWNLQSAIKYEVHSLFLRDTICFMCPTVIILQCMPPEICVVYQKMNTHKDIWTKTRLCITNRDIALNIPTWNIAGIAADFCPLYRPIRQSYAYLSPGWNTRRLSDISSGTGGSGAVL